ncbi:hypothetical protein F0562_016594 [Nyssa sinensis]|uniref:PQ-loop repeat family protein / transmembrane family protein n=1 Tax=Nyssa sinensis TaxID=561372 RepID=A0A5J4ZG42_9ASTE|nr:hypothetical protein F0562_016594 [Nyssa sinensis]
MRLLESSPPMCPRDLHCSQWAREYLKYCLCNMKDGVSLTLGLFSVISWGVAEIPQIITNYKEKSTEGLSIAFLMTWIVGDLLNLFGCMLEPATLPTQYYMAMLFTTTTMILTAQTIYYSHIYHRLKSKRQCQKGLKPIQTEAVENKRHCNYGIDKQQVNNADRQGHETNGFAPGVPPSSPIPLPALPCSSSREGELYYMSARSLSRSYTPTAGSFPAHRRTPTLIYDQNSIEEPLLSGLVHMQSAPRSSTKTMLCAVSALTFFLGSSNLHPKKSSTLKNMVFKKPNQGVVIQVGRKLLEVGVVLLQETGGTGSSGIGAYLGWGMAFIYMGGRLPQICLNIRRGNVEGLNPLMFTFALVGNATYVASILASSLDWFKIKPNLPWLVDAGGCVLLDTFILIQFIYYNYRRDPDAKALVSRVRGPMDEFRCFVRLM